MSEGSGTRSERIIPLAEPHLVGNVRKYLEECVATNFVSSVGPFVERFEREFAQFVGAGYAVACSSGTAAIHVALRILDVKRGDEVFVPTLTFVASANPILYEGASAFFVDSERETWNLDPELVVQELERRVTTGQPMPRAVEVVHLLGRAANIDAIAAACMKYGIHLIEDAAEALGAKYLQGPFAGRQVGTVGKIGCFSFNGNKVLTAGGGGMLVTDDEALAKRARHLTTQARLPGAEYRHDEVGYNYRLTNVAAAIGLAQLECLPAFLERKAQIASRYDAALSNTCLLAAPPRSARASQSNWLYTCSVPSGGAAARDRIIDRLKTVRAEARPIWTPLHLMPMYRDAVRLGGVIAEDLASRSLSLPSSVSMTDDEQDRVVEAIGTA